MLSRIVYAFLDVIDRLITVTFFDAGRALGNARDGRSLRPSQGPTPPWHVHRSRAGPSEAARRLSIAAVTTLIGGAVGLLTGVAFLWGMLLPLGLLLAVAAWFKGDRLALWVVMIAGFIAQWAVAIAAMLKYG